MKPTTDDLRQLLDLPAEIQGVERVMNGLKSDKAKKVREIEASEARHVLKIRKISKDEGYNAEDRKAALILALEDDPKHQGLVERLEAVTGMIRAHEATRDLLRRKRAGIQTQSGLHIVARLEELIKDKDLVSAIGSRLLA